MDFQRKDSQGGVDTACREGTLPVRLSCPSLQREGRSVRALQRHPAANRLPIHPRQFCVFAQLTNGLGAVPFFVDIRFAQTEELVWTTEVRELVFLNRNSVVQLVLTIEGCRFNRPGLYLLELFCNNTWVCDTQLLLREGP
jgi:hypothetical protein